MQSSDWQDFITDITWFVKKDDVVTLGQTERASPQFFDPDSKFSAAFPRLTSLLHKARVTEIIVNATTHHLYAWDEAEGRALGWLCCPPPADVPDFLHPDHKLLLRHFGGITERFNEPQSWLLNLNSALAEYNIGFGGWEENFRDHCMLYGLSPIVDMSQFLCFAFEANGNLNAYHLQTGEVIMYAHDHAFDFVIPMEGCPEYTLYRIKGCANFRSWIETVAGQWLDVITH